MVDGALARAQGGGTAKVVAESATLGDGGTFDTGLQSIDSVSVIGSAAVSEIISVTGISDGTITVAIKDNGGLAGASQTCYIVAVGA